MDKYNNIVSKAKDLTLPPREKTIFSIGGRGHYENPISDILAFFLDPREEHNLKDLFLTALSECLVETEPPIMTEPLEPTLVGQPNREAVTDKGNRIDLILEGTDWIIAIENKIFSEVNNPLKDYEHYIKKNFSKKTILFLILSPYHIKLSKPWRLILYTKLVNKLKLKWKNSIYFTDENKWNKWHVFLLDFLLNLEHQIQDIPVNEKRIEFIVSNYKEINEIISMRDEYIQYIKGKCFDILISNRNNNLVANIKPVMKQHSWNRDGIALRFYTDTWNKDSNIVILLRPNGIIRIQFYIGNIHEADTVETDAFFKNEKFKSAWTESKTTRCYGFHDTELIENAIQQFTETVNDFNRFYAIA